MLQLSVDTQNRVDLFTESQVQFLSADLIKTWQEFTANRSESGQFSMFSQYLDLLL